jgi:four helix bundle protein
MKAEISSFRDLQVYQAALRLQQELFHASKKWPREETYALTDQIRRSSRSIGANIAEAWSKRRYPAHFLSKLTDADGELQETSHWLATASDCGYLTTTEGERLVSDLMGVGKMLGAMIAKHESFCYR